MNVYHRQSEHDPPSLADAGYEGLSWFRMAEARKGVRWMAWHEGADEGRGSLR